MRKSQKSKSIKKEFNSEPPNNKKYLKTKTKSYKGKINTILNSNEIPKEGSPCICLCIILIDVVYRKDKCYYHQVLLEEFKYVVKEKKMSMFINDDIEISSDESDKEDSDEEN